MTAAERSAFVASFVAERIKNGTWPETDIQRVVMMNELAEAVEKKVAQAAETAV